MPMYQTSCQLFLFPLGHHFVQLHVYLGCLVLILELTSQWGVDTIQMLLYQGDAQGIHVAVQLTFPLYPDRV